MSRNHSHRHNTTRSYEQKPVRPPVSPAIGKRAMAHTSLVASIPDHRVGLPKGPDEPIFDNPDYFGSILGETFASTILDTANDDDMFIRRKAGEEILLSIDTAADSDALVGLKRIAAVVCGAEHTNPDYQQIMENLDSTLVPDELRDFIEYVYEWSRHGNAENTEVYVNAQMTALSGFRVEASFFRLAQAAGFTVKHATIREDHRGIDFYINGTPFDIKSSEKTAIVHTRKHKSDKRRYHAVVFVPEITVDDFAGRLVVPQENIENILVSTNFRETVENAIASYTQINA